jgi:hypothetical protein
MTPTRRLPVPNQCPQDPSSAAETPNESPLRPNASEQWLA